MLKPLILTIVLLPALANANGQLFRSGFIVDAADERLNHMTGSVSDRARGNLLTTTVRYVNAGSIPAARHQPNQYVFNTPTDVSEREFMASVRKLDKSKERYVGK